MRSKRPYILSVCLLLFVLPRFIYSSSHYKYAPEINREVYFGHISYSEIENDDNDPVVFGENSLKPEKAVLNLPLGPGDTIKTFSGRRCEVQFDTGTLLRLDYDTEVKIETILAPSLSSRRKLTNLVLKAGRIYLMYKRYNRPEIFQVITSNTAVKLNHKTVVLMDVDPFGQTYVQVYEGKLDILFGPDEESTRKHKLKKSNRVIITQENMLQVAKIDKEQEFELWNQHMNENFPEMHEGKSFLPQPIQKLPPAVFYFAQRYSNRYGEWYWHNLYGYVWRPYYNDVYPWGNWSPFVYGQWREMNSQLFWVPQEKWGWVPYHLGIWTWDKQKGWLWIPGDAFAPAWVAWNFYYGSGFFSWRPLYLWDWSFTQGFSAAYGEEYSGDEIFPEEGKRRKTLNKIRKDQLKKRNPPAYMVPKKMKSVLAKVSQAIKNRDRKLFDSLESLPHSVNSVRGEDLNSPRIQSKILHPMQAHASVEKKDASRPSMESEDAARAASQAFFLNEVRLYVQDKIRSSEPLEKAVLETLPMLQPKKLTTRVFSGTKIPGTSDDVPNNRVSEVRDVSYIAIPTSRVSMRGKDWNPDVRVAHRYGVSIRYDSRSNEVHCPELGLRSGRLTSGSRRGSRGFSGRSSYSSSGGGASSGGGSGTSSTTSSSHSGQGGRSSGGGKGGGSVKK